MSFSCHVDVIKQKCLVPLDFGVKYDLYIRMHSIRFGIFISWGAASNMRDSHDCDGVSFWKLAGLQAVDCDLSCVCSKTMWLFLGDTSGSAAFQRASPLWVETKKALKTQERVHSLGWEENKANAEQDVWLYLALTSVTIWTSAVFIKSMVLTCMMFLDFLDKSPLGL